MGAGVVTGQPPASVVSAVLAYGGYAVIIGVPVLLAWRAHRRDVRAHREHMAAMHAERMRARAREIRRELAADAVVHGPQRLPSFIACERIWAETLSYGMEPDKDLLAEWERFGKEHAT